MFAAVFLGVPVLASWASMGLAAVATIIPVLARRADVLLATVVAKVPIPARIAGLGMRLAAVLLVEPGPTRLA